MRQVLLHKPVILAGAALAALLAAGALAYLYADARSELIRARQEFASTTAELKEKVIELEGALALSNEEKTALADTLNKEQNKNSAFEKQIEGITETVGTLEKLSKTDPQLLQKYSKVYFLNEHYVPSKLVDISSDMLMNKDKTQQIHAEVFPQLEEMIEEAAEDGVTLKIVSAYRSFGTQASLKSGYTVLYGSGANRFSADQGYSEHQLGTTVDLTTPEVGGPYMSFDKTAAFEWLKDNAHKYGFVLSYPPGNAYYQYEPWHWRFVGEQLARQLHREDKYFYDMDQREINTYLVSLFD